ncbi:decaprenyl-phosphate phosphoribosyltransferase [Thermomonospora echinospora]|uniref:Decaprenyl-phosphate phosphoribosyltransferase n=1 Tax=Thermomonospora echinospora TaxID=1992 RepID=A0A1H6DMP4_9ACTN|nr:decaprenyl-phosphate phosphoribosyltransferase [Thermomonospora echinospora]SEG86518.1 decaprenyl-phosphate phosphoribosyltransferase [Thermomonospora echinospora]
MPLRDLLRSARPRQWIKNILLIAPSLTSGVLPEPRPAARLVVAFVAFSLTASGVYFINDVRDADHDREHPTKRLRPVAARALTPRLAIAVGALLVATGLLLGLSIRLGSVIGVYAAVSLAYCFLLRNLVVTDLLAVASGFPLRVIAGGQATGATVSFWLLVTTCAGSLFVVTGKRYSEAVVFGAAKVRIRPSLSRYRVVHLRLAWLCSVAVAMTAYAIWAFGEGNAFSAMSLIPFALALLRYMEAINGARAAYPEDLVQKDRTLQALGMTWLGIFAARGFA